MKENSLGPDILEHLPVLRGYALYLTRDSITAEDLVHDCVVRALDKQHKFKVGTNLRAWLTIIMHNTFVRQVTKKINKSTVFLEDFDLPVAEIPPSQYDSVLLKETIAAMGRLSPKRQDILRVLAFDGMSLEEAAEELQIPVGTIKSASYRARKTLESELA